MNFWLGAHMPHWLGFVDVPMMVARHRLVDRRTLPRAVAPWMLDSGGFNHLRRERTWDGVPPQVYAAQARRLFDQVGNLAFVAPQDWMCEDDVLRLTGMAVAEHQRRTVSNLLDLRTLSPDMPIIPVLQGFTRDDYLRCADLYAAAGIDLEAEPLVGLGSVCRRQNTNEIGQIVGAFPTLRLHGFGCKVGAIEMYGHLLASADSMAWSLNGSHVKPCVRRPELKSCANCLHHALAWRDDLLAREPRPFQMELCPA